jgi:predicted nucleotidyltransferase component of viral defense system
MISRRYIEEWKATAPWPENAQVEQDLIIERALVEIFSDDLLRDNLAFRGGTALHKIYLRPPARYSEDIDLVQTREGPIKPLLVRLRERLEFLGTKRIIDQSLHNNTIIYPFESEIAPVIKMKLKIEINTREHFNVLGIKPVKLQVENGWFSGTCNIASYEMEELLGTKLRALYQRRKSRDLFDLYWAYQHHSINTELLLHCYREYMKFNVDQPPTQKMFIANIEKKMKDKDFTGDINVILRPGVEYDNEASYEFIKTKLLQNI